MSQTALDLYPEKPVALPPRQHEALQALRILFTATTGDLQRMLEKDYGIKRDRSALSKRLQELEAKGLAQRTGHDFTKPGNPTTWRAL